MSMSPTERTMKRLKELGFTAGIVEKRIPFKNITIDLFKFADIVAVREGVGILFIQTTTGEGGAHAARIAKINAEPRAKHVCAAGGKIEVWSWAKRGDRGKRKLWTLRREEVCP